MNCPRCGAWSDVSATRPLLRGFVVRRARTCANGHRFHSYEVAGPTAPAGGGGRLAVKPGDQLPVLDPRLFAPDVLAALDTDSPPVVRSSDHAIADPPTTVHTWV